MPRLVRSESNFPLLLELLVSQFPEHYWNWSHNEAGLQTSPWAHSPLAKSYRGHSWIYIHPERPQGDQNNVRFMLLAKCDRMQTTMLRVDSSTSEVNAIGGKNGSTVSKTWVIFKIQSTRTIKRVSVGIFDTVHHITRRVWHDPRGGWVTDNESHARVPDFIRLYTSFVCPYLSDLLNRLISDSWDGVVR